MTFTIFRRLLLCVLVIVASLGVWIVFTRRLTAKHGLEVLIDDAEIQSQLWAAQEAHTFSQAVDAYRQRRGRCPPPGFRAFHERLQQFGAISIEPFWDQIYDDLEPFWGVQAEATQRAAASLVSNAPFQNKIARLQGFSVRRGEVQAFCPPEDMTCDDQLGLLKGIAALLPDMDVAVSVHASPRMLVPWSVMAYAREQARQQSRLISGSAGAQTHVHAGISRPSIEAAQVDTAKGWNRELSPYSFLGVICPPKNESFGQEQHQSAAVQDVCARPELASIHGTLLAPQMLSTTSQLLPIFSATHIRHVSAEITIPDLHTWVDIREFTLPSHLVNQSLGVPWSEKSNKAFWRGTNTGGKHDSSTWKKSHRHRFVALMNSTFLEATSSGVIDWTNASLRSSAALEPPPLRWMSEHLDCAFSELRCAERRWDVGHACSYLDQHFQTGSHVSLADMASYRYLPDVDGNAYSARFRALLMTGSAVLKATIFDEWHQSRLIPYKHFIPFDLGSLPDLWHKLCFFIGGCCKGRSCAGRDRHAEAIGVAAATWSRRVLRKADMELYWLRLLLEYARVVDERRHVLCEREDTSAPSHRT